MFFLFSLESSLALPLVFSPLPELFLSLLGLSLQVPGFSLLLLMLFLPLPESF